MRPPPQQRKQGRTTATTVRTGCRCYWYWYCYRYCCCCVLLVVVIEAVAVAVLVAVVGLAVARLSVRLASSACHALQPSGLTLSPTQIRSADEEHDDDESREPDDSAAGLLSLSGQGAIERNNCSLSHSLALTNKADRRRAQQETESVVH